MVKVDTVRTVRSGPVPDRAFVWTSRRRSIPDRTEQASGPVSGDRLRQSPGQTEWTEWTGQTTSVDVCGCCGEVAYVRYCCDEVDNMREC